MYLINKGHIAEIRHFLQIPYSPANYECLI